MGRLFPQDPLIHLSIETERQKGLKKNAASMQGRPVLSSTPLSTKDPVLEELEDELPTLPALVRKGCKDALP
ncbi:hypothetical protein CRENBAI_011041 [Crenichthys baileyi]|uniref:Uncharacterized protein n=1 Tax=Crenichthys baileyi TaxID=28760 RepID=A0AAV9RMM8_9TELE